jgi:uncharacterized protein YkwD
VLCTGLMLVQGAARASGYTLRLTFPDGAPMTYGSACSGLGCLQRDDGIRRTDDAGEIALDPASGVVEYRRDGIALAQAAPGVASGTVLAGPANATVILPRVLIGSAPDVDGTELAIVARVNQRRADSGLPDAQLSSRLSVAADEQAAWLAQSQILVTQPERFHLGPFDTTVAFRLGEASVPEPDNGGEVVEAGGTPEQVVADWMASDVHREILLEPGRRLVGIGRVGSFTVVETHPPCAGCDQPASTAAPGAAPAAPAPRPQPTAGSSAGVRPLCTRELLRITRLRNLAGRVRLRVATSCLRGGSTYELTVRQGSAGRLLAVRRIAGAGTVSVSARPPRRTAKLRIKLKRGGRAIVARTLRLHR